MTRNISHIITFSSKNKNYFLSFSSFLPFQSLSLSRFACCYLKILHAKCCTYAQTCSIYHNSPHVPVQTVILTLSTHCVTLCCVHPVHLCLIVCDSNTPTLHEHTYINTHTYTQSLNIHKHILYLFERNYIFSGSTMLLCVCTFVLIWVPCMLKGTAVL